MTDFVTSQTLVYCSRKVDVSDVSGKVSGVVKTVFLEAKSTLFVREVVKTIFYYYFLSVRKRELYTYIRTRSHLFLFAGGTSMRDGVRWSSHSVSGLLS